MRRPAFYIFAKTKMQINCAVFSHLISAFVFLLFCFFCFVLFATHNYSAIALLVNSKFQAYSLLL